MSLLLMIQCLFEYAKKAMTPMEQSSTPSQQEHKATDNENGATIRWTTKKNYLVYLVECKMYFCG